MVMWMVRSGDGGRYADDARAKGIVGLGWSAIGDPNRFASKVAMVAAVKGAFPEFGEGTVASSASQLWRFKNEVKQGDAVLTFDRGKRIYHLGVIESDPLFDPNEVEELSYQRQVRWLPEPIYRDSLSPDSKNRLGSVLTLFKVPSVVAKELEALASGTPLSISTSQQLIADEEGDPYAKIDELAVLRIADRISSLDWSDMQRLVAALLRAMGYKTIISPDGPDRGKDILASPDGFGFENPRIVVEVKHRKGQMGAPEVRSFIGGRHKDDRGLYVSTGGFSREAHYEAERSNIAIKLMNLDDLSRAVIDYYESFDNEGRALLPLSRLYWPA
jgi:restriction system protein